MKAICSKCKVEKDLTEFKKDKSKKLGRSSQCKECQKPYAKKYQLENLDKWQGYTKKWRENNLEQSRKINKDYYESNKDAHKKRMKIWNENNPDYMKEWHSQNREEYNLKQRKRWNNDPVHRLKGNIRTRIYRAIKDKSEATFELLGCPIEEYIVYLEKQFYGGMSWENYGKYWEIDHVIPLSKGGSYHYTNTQPLTITENRTKKDNL